MDKILAFFNDFKQGLFGFGVLKEKVGEFRDTVIGNPDLGFLKNLVDSLAGILPFIMIGVMLIMAFFGKKLLPLAKFIFFFVLGFDLGVVYINPLIDKIVDIPSWVSGLILGILAAILYRLLYVLFFATAVFYSVFNVCYLGLGDALSGMGTMAPYIFMGVAAVAVILAFVLRKYVEMLATAALGGYVIADLLGKHVFGNYAAISFLAGNEWIATLVIAVVIALPGFIVQVKTRRRY